MGIFVGDKSREHDLGLPATPHSLHLEAKPCYKGKQKKTIDIKELTPEMKIREKETVTYGDHSSGQTFQSLKPSQMLYTLKFCSLQINKTIKKYNWSETATLRWVLFCFVISTDSTNGICSL